MAGPDLAVASEGDCVRALREAADRLGESPAKADYEALGLRPASATIQRVMGGWNEAKEAAGLETNPSTGSRVEPKPDDVELPEGLEWNELSQDQRWHYKNRAWNTERSLQRRAEIRAWANDIKATAGCARCSEDDPACLDFHHIDEDEKAEQITTMISYGYGRDKILDEMAKCEVLCANCHRKEHFEPPDV
ncbi:homing endonuclease associated repeat-containing protein [Haloarcula onubensis]|uniref:HNH endonuclease n=1 Tax=Haloarcula onubensis TaxID=2950539 RepID=A0ABU2FP35_9EURY|nr:HNH endonuclease [Halomicroarcula sp. S3CR25-11]MDS0282525.1 HNH endonuclease [Halomicroarcula sp. S3CR25-11]